MINENNLMLLVGDWMLTVVQPSSIPSSLPDITGILETISGNTCFLSNLLQLTPLWQIQQCLSCFGASFSWFKQFTFVQFSPVNFPMRTNVRWMHGVFEMQKIHRCNEYFREGSFYKHVCSVFLIRHYHSCDTILIFCASICVELNANMS